MAPNDNFWKISKKHYGTARFFMALTRYNQAQIADPTQMKPGMQVATPPREVLESRFPNLIEHTPVAGQLRSVPENATPTAAVAAGNAAQSGFFVGETGEPMYRVGHDDTLTGISQKHLGRASRWVEILEKNRDALKTPEALRIGTVIRLPADASRLTLVRPAEERR